MLCLSQSTQTNCIAEITFYGRSGILSPRIFHSRHEMYLFCQFNKIVPTAMVSQLPMRRIHDQSWQNIVTVTYFTVPCNRLLGAQKNHEKHSTGQASSRLRSEPSTFRIQVHTNQFVSVSEQSTLQQVYVKEKVRLFNRKCSAGLNLVCLLLQILPVVEASTGCVAFQTPLTRTCGS